MEDFQELYSRQQREKSALPEFAEADVAEVDGHGRAAVDLESDEAGFAEVGGIFIDGNAHDFAIEDVDEGVALRDDGHGVPVGGIFDVIEGLFGGGEFHFFQGGAGAGVSEFFFVAEGFDGDVFAGVGHEHAPVFLEEHAGEAIGVLEIGLVALEDVVGQAFAAVLHAGVAALDAVLEGELEIAEFGVGVDEEGVFLEGIFGVGLRVNGAILNGEIFRFAIPAGEIFAVEKGLVGGVIGSKGGGGEKNGAENRRNVFHKEIWFGRG